jgi:hypothetical protein
MKNNQQLLHVSTRSGFAKLHLKFLCIRMTSVGKKKCIYIYDGNIVIWQNCHWDAVNFNLLGDRIGRKYVNKRWVKEDCQYILLI